MHQLIKFQNLDVHLKPGATKQFFDGWTLGLHSKCFHQISCPNLNGLCRVTTAEHITMHIRGCVHSFALQNISTSFQNTFHPIYSSHLPNCQFLFTSSRSFTSSSRMAEFSFLHLKGETHQQNTNKCNVM